MSVFRVSLNNTNQGRLDIDPSTGVPFTTSVQRSVYVMGPHKTNRLLKDGDTFTDSNYWKRFAYPQVSLDQAIVTVVTDDGSVFSDVETENTYPVTWLPGAAETGVITGGEAYDDTNMSLDILSTYGGPATFVQLQNVDSSHDITVRLNGSTDAVFTLRRSTTQVFNEGDLSITKIEFDNSASGAGTVNAVDVILGVRSVSNS